MHFRFYQRVGDTTQTWGMTDMDKEAFNKIEKEIEEIGKSTSGSLDYVIAYQLTRIANYLDLLLQIVITKTGTIV